LCEETAFAPYARYVDPVLACIIALVIIQTPIKLMKESFLELLDSSPDEDFQAHVNTIVQNAFSFQSRIQLTKVQTAKAGRHVFIKIGYDLPDMISRKDLDACNLEITQSLQKQFRSVSVNFFVH